MHIFSYKIKFSTYLSTKSNICSVQWKYRVFLTEPMEYKPANLISELLLVCLLKLAHRNFVFCRFHVANLQSSCILLEEISWLTSRGKQGVQLLPLFIRQSSELH